MNSRTFERTWHQLMRQTLLYPAVVAMVMLVSSCEKPKSADSEEVQKLRREMEEMKVHQAAATPATPVPTATPVPEATLTGSVFYRTKSGETTVLSASRVYLLTPSVARPSSADLKAANLTINDSLDFTVALKGPTWDWSHYNNLEVEEIEKPARRTPFQCTTDLAGKYSFQNVEPGDYYLFTTINTTKAVGFWYQKITVPEGRTTTVDLNNSNMKAVAENVEY